MPTQHLTTKVLARGTHIHSMHAHVCHPAPATVTHLLRPPPSQQLHGFTAAAAIPGAVHRCPHAHNFQPPPRRCNVPFTGPGTSICRLLPPSRAIAALTAHLARRGTATHRHEVLRQAGSARTPTAAPAARHRPLQPSRGRGLGVLGWYSPALPARRSIPGTCAALHRKPALRPLFSAHGWDSPWAARSVTLRWSQGTKHADRARRVPTSR